MRSYRAIRIVRRLLIARCFAVLFIALAISPWTAPFAAVDVAEFATDAGATKDAAKLFKLAKDAGDVISPDAALVHATSNALRLEDRPLVPPVVSLVRIVVLRI